MPNYVENWVIKANKERQIEKEKNELFHSLYMLAVIHYKLFPNVKSWDLSMGKMNRFTDRQYVKSIFSKNDVW